MSNLIINIITNVIICILGITSSYFSGKTFHNHKKIKTKLNSIEDGLINNTTSNKNKKRKSEIDEIESLFIEFENKLRELLSKKQ